jgi:hypothetical protein
MEDGSCSCGDGECKHIGKHSMTDDGFYSASNDPEKVRWFFNGEPDANIAVRTGAVSGVIVVDIDPRHGGDQSLAHLLQENGPLPVTVTVKTGGGGSHFYFRHPGQGLTVPNRQDMLPGIDVRGDGGYVLAPPSNHTRDDYSFEPGRAPNEVPLAPAPLWLLDLILGNTEAAPTAAPTTEGMLGRGERHPTLFAMAGAMRQKGMSRAGIEAALRAENAARCSPPLEEKEIQKLVRGALKYPAGGVPKARFVSVPLREGVVQETIQAFETAADPRMTAQEVKWLVRPYVAEGAITLLTGRAKASGKSTFTCHMLARVLDGHHFLGQPTQKTGAVYMTEERSTFVELLKRSGLLGRPELRFLRYDPARDATFAEQVAAAREVAKAIGAKVLIVDTVAQHLALRGDSENEAGATLEALRPLQEAAREGLAVIAIHHERKGGGEVGDGGRGSSAFAGAVDVILSLRRPDGQTSPGVRVLHALSRFAATPPVQYVELTEHGFEPRDEGGVVTAAAERVLLENAPTSEGEALTIVALIEGTDIKEPTARKAARKLVTEGRLRETGDGVRGSPKRYWKLPPTDSDTTPTP